MIPVAIIGAGVAGLACARRLVAGGIQPVLFDKGRGIGGRVATRRVQDLQFDHGAQFVTARNAPFSALLQDLAASGAAAPWDDGTDLAKTVGRPGMSALAKAMAAGLDIRQNAQVTSILPAKNGWVLCVGGTEQLAARVIVTVPAPQVAGLLGAEHPLIGALAAVRMAPCLTLMAAVRGAAPFVTHTDPNAALAWVAQDSSKPGRPQGEAVAWVAQAGQAFSEKHLEQTPADITALMLPLLCDLLGVSSGAVTHADAHRWRYARVTQALGLPFLRSQDASLYLGGDWCIGPRVEAAWDSGVAIAADLLAQS